MTVKEAADLLGRGAETIRAGLRLGVFDFGVAFKTNDKNQHYTYIIYPAKVREYARGKGVQ